MQEGNIMKKWYAYFNDTEARVEFTYTDKPHKCGKKASPTLYFHNQSIRAVEQGVCTTKTLYLNHNDVDFQNAINELNR